MAKAEPRFTTLIAGCSAIIAVLIGAASAHPIRVTDDWVTLRPPGGGFRVLMPPDWRQDTPRTPNGKLSFIAKQPAPSGRPGVTNCNVVVGSTPETANYAQASIDAEITAGPASPELANSIASALHDASVRENRVVRVSNHVAYFIVYSGSYESLDTKAHSVVASILVIRPGWTYGLACGAADKAPEGAEAAWNSWQPVLMRILSTFEIEDH